MTAAKPKRKRGRPPWIPPPLDQVRSLAGRGLTQEKIADFFGIHISTLCEKKHFYPEFAEALQKGKAEIEFAIADRLVEEALRGSFPHAAFYLERRAGWKRPTDSEAPSAASRGGLSSDLVAVLRQALLGELREQIEQEPERPAIEVTARPMEAPVNVSTDIALRRAELLGTNGKVKE